MLCWYEWWCGWVRSCMCDTAITGHRVVKGRMSPRATSRAHVLCVEYGGALIRWCSLSRFLLPHVVARARSMPGGTPTCVQRCTMLAHMITLAYTHKRGPDKIIHTHMTHMTKTIRNLARAVCAGKDRWCTSELDWWCRNVRL